MSLKQSIELYNSIQELGKLAEQAANKVEKLEAEKKHLEEINAMLQRENKLLTDIIRDNARQQLLKPDPN